ncbi:MAG TPA: hypothetical protein PLJ13_16925, partial [Cyclobacteriaceae bacterium]|nr:hypothetical protein [Cyclobacteriaceae bacterium]
MILLIGTLGNQEWLIVGFISLLLVILLSLLIGTFLYKRKLKRNEQAITEKAKLIVKEAELQA